MACTLDAVRRAAPRRPPARRRPPAWRQRCAHLLGRRGANSRSTCALLVKAMASTSPARMRASSSRRAIGLCVAAIGVQVGRHRAIPCAPACSAGIRSAAGSAPRRRAARRCAGRCRSSPRSASMTPARGRCRSRQSVRSPSSRSARAGFGPRVILRTARQRREERRAQRGSWRSMQPAGGAGLRRSAGSDRRSRRRRDAREPASTGPGSGASTICTSG